MRDVKIQYFNLYEQIFSYLNYPNKNLLIATKSISSIFGNLKPIDRTNFIEYSFPTQKITIPAPADISFEQCMFLRAIELSKINQSKKILWSGGIDSTALIVALLMHDTISNYQIVCTPSALEEYPWFYKKYIQQTNHVIISEKMPEKFFNIVFDGSYVITGNLGDQLVMDYDLVDRHDIELDEPWSQILKLLRPFPQSSEAMYILTTHAKNAPVEIKTIEDIYHWIYFVFDWHGDIFKYSGALNKPQEIQKHIAFFNTEEFQSWSLFNKPILKIYNWKNLHNHKKIFKQYICDYTKDTDYMLTKRKCNSYKMHFDQPVPYGNFVITDDYQIIPTANFLKDL